MTRRRALFSLLALVLAAAPAVAQEPADRSGAEPAAAPRPAPKPRGTRRRAARRRGQAGDAPQQQAAPEPETGPHLEAAPVPNRDLEAPRAPSGTDRTRLAPSVIHRPLPNQGMAAEGAQSIQEERLFFPAPGARLKVPFSY